MKTISIFPFVAIFTLIAISCEKKYRLEDIDPPKTETQDSLLMENLDNCDSNHSGQFTFEYQGNIYQFTNPSVTVFVDSIPGSSYFLSDSVTFYKKSIIIKAPMNENEEIYLYYKKFRRPIVSVFA